MVLWAISSGEICNSCICEGVVAECYLETCQDVIVKRGNVEIIKVFGLLCDNHRMELLDSIYHNTIFLLFDDHCKDIPNCSDEYGDSEIMTTVKTETTTSEPWWFPPAPPFPINNADDDDDDDMTTSAVSTEVTPEVSTMESDWLTTKLLPSVNPVVPTERLPVVFPSVKPIVPTERVLTKVSSAKPMTASQKFTTMIVKRQTPVPAPQDTTTYELMTSTTMQFEDEDTDDMNR